jgi:hypothetical protein
MSEPNTERVVFDEAQQKRVDELIRESMGRAASSVKAELAATQTKLTTLQAELQAAKDAAAIATGDVAKAKDAEIEKARSETVAVRKQNVITAAGAKYNFYDPAQLAKLCSDEIKWDGTKFVVLGEDGTPRVGLDGSTPLSVDEFFREFSQKNPHLVKADIKPGIGSREATQPPHRTLGQREKLSQYFGRGSSSVKANALALESPQTYKAMKREAKSIGLIP